MESVNNKDGTHTRKTQYWSRQVCRKFNNTAECHLNPKIFIEIINGFRYSETDLFATTINTQLQNYVSWSCEPDTKAADTFLTDCE